MRLADLTDEELLVALRGVGDGKTDATALVQEFYDRQRGLAPTEPPPPGVYLISETVRA